MSATPSLGPVIFKLSDRHVAGEIKLKPEEWRVIAQMNGARSVAEIAGEIGMEISAVESIAQAMHQAGVLQVVPPPPPPSADPAFFDQLTRELTRVMGPLAAVIVEDELDELGVTRDQFPRDRVQDLVERVSQAIRDETKRNKFQQVMLEIIRKT